MISIIVPIYNAEKYIQRCIECVLSQDYENWELILINDGSTDNSKIICEKIAENEPKIQVICQENKGASVARKVGIEHAKGEFLVFIDCDDLVEKNYLSTLFNAIQTKQTKIAACRVTKHPEEESPVIPQPAAPVILEEKELFSRFFRYEFWGYVDKIYHKSVFDGIHFPTHTINEDYVVMLQLFQKEHRIAYVETPLYHYLIHPNSLSHQKISKRAFDEYHNKIWAYHYCTEKLPQYKKQAEAQVAESCIKLTRMIKTSDSAQSYSTEYHQMKSFLSDHLFSILASSHLVFGLKIMTLKSIF